MFFFTMVDKAVICKRCTFEGKLEMWGTNVTTLHLMRVCVWPPISRLSRLSMPRASLKVGKRLLFSLQWVLWSCLALLCKFSSLMQCASF